MYGAPQGQLLVPGGDPNLPQPPNPQQQPPPEPQPQPMTLGQANGAPPPGPQPTLGDPSGLPPGNPILDQYNQAISSTLDLLQQRGLIQQPIPPQPGPSLLESLGTFGIANLKHIADENTRREQNYVRTQQNRDIAMKGVGLATKMVDAQVAGGTANQRLQLAIQGQGLQIAKFLNDQDNEAHRRAQETLNREFKGQKRPAPTTAIAKAQMEDDGWGPSATDPAWWEFKGTDEAGGGGLGGGPKLTKQPDGSWGVDPNTPMGRKLAQVGGGGAGGGGGPAPLVKQPGESNVDFVERKKRAAAVQTKLDVPTSQTRSMAEMAPKVLSLADQVEQSLNAIKAGPLKSRAQEFTAGTLGIGNAPFTKYRTDVGLLQTSLMRMHVGARGGEQMMQHFKTLLDGAKQSPENMKAALEEIRTYAHSMLPKDSATTQTTTSSTPPSTGGPTQGTPSTGVTPSGIRFRVVP